MSLASNPAWTRRSASLRLRRAEPDAVDRPPIRVAIIDSGVDFTHPALAGCAGQELSMAFSWSNDEVVSSEGGHDDVFGHGTACAGIIHSLAPEVSISSVRVLDETLGTKAVVFHDAFSWAIDQGFDVINLSLGSHQKEWALAFHELCDRAYFAGVVVVTAANNVSRTSFPSLYASVLSVACTTTNDPERFHFNPDPPTEFLAPGISVDVSWLNHGISTVTGNSYAAPHIAGHVARLLTEQPGLMPFQVKHELRTRAANVVESRGGGGKFTQMRARGTGAISTKTAASRATAGTATSTRSVAI